MKVCVVGCGAIGGLYAAHLGTLDDVKVWAYDVSTEHVDAINRDGLRLTGAANVTARVEARTDAAEIPPCEFGIVAVKGTFTDLALAATAHVFGDGAVCSVQNGIGNEEVIAEHVPRVLRGVCLPAADPASRRVRCQVPAAPRGNKSSCRRPRRAITWTSGFRRPTRCRCA